MIRSISKAAVVAVAFGMTLGLNLSCAHAQDAHNDHAAAQPAQAQFNGDPYLLGTDPISGEKLPDKPVVHQHDRRELRFADEKSLATFKAGPAAYLAKVDQQMIQQQASFYPLETCMVSGDKLGGDMGKPVDTIYMNRLVRFCCNDCVKDFKKDPAKYITKLNEAVIAKQGAKYPVSACVVSGDKLGGDMGKPVDVVVGNRLVRLCCNDCLKDLNKDPLKYLKMIDDAAQK